MSAVGVVGHVERQIIRRVKEAAQNLLPACAFGVLDQVGDFRKTASLCSSIRLKRRGVLHFEFGIVHGVAHHRQGFRRVVRAQRFEHLHAHIGIGGRERNLSSTGTASGSWQLCRPHAAAAFTLIRFRGAALPTIN